MNYDLYRLRHYLHGFGLFHGSTKGATGIDAPEFSSDVSVIEARHPFYRIEKAITAVRNQDSAAFKKCFKSETGNDPLHDSRQDIERAWVVVTGLANVVRYLAIPNPDYDIFTVDVWSSGRRNHEKQIRFFLEKRRESWIIARVFVKHPWEVTVDSSGCEENESFEFDNVGDDLHVDSYADVPAESGTEAVLNLLKVARTSALHEFVEHIEHKHRPFALSLLLLFQSIRRVLAVEERRTELIGVNDEGVLTFKTVDLDVTFVNWNKEVVNWQVTLQRERDRFVVAGLDDLVKG